MNIKYLIICGLILSALVLIFPPVQAADYGNLEVIVRAGGSAQDLTVFLKQADNPIQFDSRYHADRTEIVGQNEGWYRIKVQPNGISFPEVFYAQDYTACLRNGNGNQKECQNFTLVPNAHLRIVFLGAAVSSGHKETQDIPDEPVEPVCITTKEWIPGYYTYEEVWECYGYSSQSCHCEWVTKCVWHPGHWESKTECK